MTDTRERILDAAEECFATRGISGTSLRALTRVAGVNLAAVHYHFGSKEGLVDAVVARRAQPVNEERLRQLDAAERGGTPDVEEILRAFLLPAALTAEALVERAPSLARLYASIHAQPSEVLEALLRRHFGAVNARFVEALERALPHLEPLEVSDRFRLLIGCVNHVFSGNFELDTTPGRPAPKRPPQQVFEHLIAFVAAGLSAPSSARSRAPALCAADTTVRARA